METRTSTMLAIVGIIVCIPALIIVSGGAWQVFTGEPNIWESLFHLTAQSLIIHPILVVGGLMSAIALNAVTTIRFRIQPQQDALSTTVTINWKTLNIVVLTMSTFFLLMIVSYSFVENFRIVPK